MGVVRRRENATPAEREVMDLRGPKRAISLPSRKPSGDRVALVDVEICLYQVCLEMLEETAVNEEEYTWTLDAAGAAAEVGKRVMSWVRECGCSRVVLAVGSSSNWRKSLCGTYKSNRDGKKKPLGYRAVLARLRDEFVVNEIANLEADDVLGILATTPQDEGGDVGNCVIVSSDKDMRTVPGLHYNPMAGGSTFEVTQDQARVEHAVRALAGDAADGYKGCPGVGEKTAVKALAECSGAEQEWRAALAMFTKAGMSEDEAVEQFRLARVLQHGDYDARTGVVTLWTPPATRRRLTKK